MKCGICIHPTLLPFSNEKAREFLEDMIGKNYISNAKTVNKTNAFDAEEVFIFVEFEDVKEDSNFMEFCERIERGEVLQICQIGEKLLWNSLPMYDLDDEISVADYKKLPRESKRWNIPNPIDNPSELANWYWTCSKAERNLLNGKKIYDVCQIQYVTLDQYSVIKRKGSNSPKYYNRNSPYIKSLWLKEPPREPPTPPPHQEPLTQVELWMLRRILNKNSKELVF